MGALILSVNTFRVMPGRGSKAALKSKLLEMVGMINASAVS
jgi:hypothetical protein